MKCHLRRIAAFVLAVVFTLSAIPAEAAAAPRERDRDLPSAIVRVVKKFQKLFGITTLEGDNQPIPPRPLPEP